MKKPSKPVTSPAPATSRAAPVPGPAKKPAAAPQTARAPRATTSPARADKPRETFAALPASAVAVVTETPAGTLITAEVDVGFGNTLYLRGEGPGLSWNKGLALTNNGATRWTISLPHAGRPVVFKFLLNDEIWSTGEDYRAEPGVALVLAPGF